jgi:hypothetical protein
MITEGSSQHRVFRFDGVEQGALSCCGVELNFYLAIHTG